MHWKLCICNTYNWPKPCYSELYFYSTSHFLLIVALFTLFFTSQALQSSLNGQNANSLASNRILLSAFFLQNFLSRTSLSGIMSGSLRLLKRTQCNVYLTNTLIYTGWKCLGLNPTIQDLSPSQPDLQCITIFTSLRDPKCFMPNNTPVCRLPLSCKYKN